MFGGSRKLIIIAAFTVVLIALVNLAWWLFYDRTEAMLDSQLSRRLLAIAKTTAIPFTPEMVQGLLDDDFDYYITAIDIVNQAKEADSLSEIFVLGPTFNYLATTAFETDSVYFLSELNGPYLDSIFFGQADYALVTPSYQTGQLYLKSAFAPLRDSEGTILAVLGVEANVDYFDALSDLRQNLYYSTALSIVGGIAFGLLFLLVQRRLNLAQSQLFVNETHAYLGRMVAVVAHEVRNPLMIIRASAERMLKKHQAVESEFIVDEVDRLNQIVTGYLDVAKGGAGASLLKTEKAEQIDLTTLVANLKKHFSDKYAALQVEWLEHDVPAGLTMVGYARPLRQVLLNLLINGADACIGAQLPIVAGIEIESRGDKIAITVVDGGPGMKKSDRKRAGELFYSTKQTGSGLGLYLSRKIVDEMGGQLSIRSRPGHGTKVELVLPFRMET
ncbi:MAG: HAMP domain-containing sensor histidine kinase [bacterium]